MPWIHIREVQAQLHSFLSSALDGGEWLNSHTGRFTHGSQQIIGDLVGLTAGQEVLTKIKTFAPTEIRTPERPARTLDTANTLHRLLGKSVSQNKDSAY